jgi:hypothetical protein
MNGRRLWLIAYWPNENIDADRICHMKEKVAVLIAYEGEAVAADRTRMRTSMLITYVK